MFSKVSLSNVSFFGSRNSLKKDFLELIDLVKSGAVDLEKIITDEYTVDNAPQAFEDFDKNAANMLKVVIKF